MSDPVPLYLTGPGPLVALYRAAAAAVDGLELVDDTGPTGPGAVAAVLVAGPVPDPPAALASAPGPVPALVALGVPLGPTPAAVDSAVEIAGATATALAAIPLLHAPAVRRALDFVSRLGVLNHLQVGVAVPRDAGVPGDSAPGLAAVGGAVAVALTAVREPVTGVAVTDGGGSLVVDLLGHRGRAARLVLRSSTTGLGLEIEAADPAGMVRLELDTEARLVLDGRPVRGGPDPAAPSPLHLWGHVAQLERIRDVVRGRASAWPPVATVADLTRIEMAARWARARGDTVDPSTIPDDRVPPGGPLAPLPAGG